MILLLAFLFPQDSKSCILPFHVIVSLGVFNMLGGYSPFLSLSIRMQTQSSASLDYPCLH